MTEGVTVIKMSESTYAIIKEIQKKLLDKTEFTINYKDIVKKVCNNADLTELCKGLDTSYKSDEKDKTMAISKKTVDQIDAVRKHYASVDPKRMYRKNVIDKVFNDADLSKIFGIPL